MAKRPAPPNRIAQLRKERHLSQQELGELIGSHYVTISKLETGKLPLTHEWSERIADILRVDPADLALGEKKRKVYVSGTIEGGARVDMWASAGPEDTLFIETDLYSGDGRKGARWLMVNGDALYPVFQHLDMLRISLGEESKMEELQGNLCVIVIDERKEDYEGNIILVGIPTSSHGNGVYDIHMLNGPLQKKKKIIEIARVSAALFSPSIDDAQFKDFQKNYLGFRDDEDRPRYMNIADWLKRA